MFLIYYLMIKNLYLIFEIIKGKKIRKVSRDDIKECLKFLKK